MMVANWAAVREVSGSKRARPVSGKLPVPTIAPSRLARPMASAAQWSGGTSPKRLSPARAGTARERETARVSAADKIRFVIETPFFFQKYIIFPLALQGVLWYKYPCSNAWNGKIAGYTHQRGAAAGCKPPWRKARLVRPGAAPERGTASPPLSEVECAPQARIWVVPRKGCLSSQCGAEGFSFCPEPRRWMY